MNETITHFVSCPCQHCSGYIEFEVERFQDGITIQCPHCGLETKLFLPQKPQLLVPEQRVPPTISEAKRRKERKTICLVVGAVASSICLVLLLVIFMPATTGETARSAGFHAGWYQAGVDMGVQGAKKPPDLEQLLRSVNLEDQPAFERQYQDGYGSGYRSAQNTAEKLMRMQREAQDRAEHPLGY